MENLTRLLVDKEQRERLVARQAPYSRAVRKGCDLKLISRGVGHLGGQLLTISIFEAIQNKNSVVTLERVQQELGSQLIS